MVQVEYVWSRLVKIALDGSREFPPNWAVFPLFSYDGFGCHRLARSADRAVPLRLGRFLAVITIARATPIGRGRWRTARAHRHRGACARNRRVHVQGLRTSLPAWRLHHGRTNGDAVPKGAAVAGATHPSGCLVRHGDGWDVHAIPLHAWGRSRTINPCGKAIVRRGGAADHEFRRPRPLTASTES